MPNIKHEHASKLGEFLSTRSGEIITVGILGAVAYTTAVSIIGSVISFISQTVYPFSYSFISSPLHSYLPRIAVSPTLPASIIFGASLTLALYYFEKNIFYRRFHILLKSGFASIAACSFVFVSNLLAFAAEIAGLGGIDLLFFTVETNELPLLFIYYYLLSIPLFSLCDLIRRRIFGLP